MPIKVMKQRFGAGVRQEVLGEVISQSFQEAVMSENLRPAGQPSIEARKMDAGQDVEYTATFEVFPAVEVISLDDLSIEKPVADVTDADIDDIIEVFRKQQGKLVDVERAAAEGDTVIMISRLSRWRSLRWRLWRGHRTRIGLGSHDPRF